MTRNQRLRRRLGMEQRQAKRCQFRQEQAVTKARQEELIATNLGRRPAKAIGKNFESQVFSKAPRLARCIYAAMAVRAIKRAARYFDLSTWQPSGKSAATQLNSLAEYLFADWPMPPILWSAFWDESSTPFRKAVVSIGRGCSLHSLCQTGEFPIPLTKKQCHSLLQMPAKMTLMEAVRLVQIKGLGGDKLLFQEWWQSPGAKLCHKPGTEKFWQQCLNWLVKHRAVAEPEKRLLSGKFLIELFSWLRFKHNADKEFSLRKRSVNNVLADVQLWQKQQALLRLAQGLNLPESGYRGMKWQQKCTVKNRDNSPFCWQMLEIRSKSQLHAEGNAMRHCVYSYKRQIEKGVCSIWTLTCNGQRSLTIELRNHSGFVAQIKGKANRDANPIELDAVKYWANQNDLQIMLTE